jgi:hypothetical protein
LVTAKKVLTSSPLHSPQRIITRLTPPRSTARRSGKTLPSHRIRKWRSFKIERQMIRMKGQNTIATGRMASQIAGVVRSIPKSSRTSFCQPTNPHKPATTSNARTTNQIRRITCHHRAAGLGIPKKFQTHCQDTPNP